MSITQVRDVAVLLVQRLLAIAVDARREKERAAAAENLVLRLASILEQIASSHLVPSGGQTGTQTGSSTAAVTDAATSTARGTTTPQVVSSTSMAPTSTSTSSLAPATNLGPDGGGNIFNGGPETGGSTLRSEITSRMSVVTTLGLISTTARNVKSTASGIAGVTSQGSTQSTTEITTL